MGEVRGSTYALSLNPNSSGAYASLGSIHTYSGRPLEAIPALERATRLDPAFTPGHLHFLGMAYLLAGKYETAVAVLKERILLVPGTDFSRVLLASALGHLGEVDECPFSSAFPRANGNAAHPRNCTASPYEPRK